MEVKFVYYWEDDPYLNFDAGTMNPYQHGEVFVLNDGGEVDLDLGNYERFLNRNLGEDRLQDHWLTDRTRCCLQEKVQFLQTSCNSQ